MKRFLKGITAERYLMWAAGTLFFAISLTLLAIVFSMSWAKNWDVLAFTGSIIGGIITWLGIRFTIKNQYKLEYTKTYPNYIRAADKIIRETSNVMRELELSIEADEYDGLELALQEYMEKQSAMLDTALDVNAMAYHWLMDFNTDILRLSFLIKRLKKTNNQKAVDTLKSIQETINHCYENIINEVNAEELKYNRIFYG